MLLECEGRERISLAYAKRVIKNEKARNFPSTVREARVRTFTSHSCRMEEIEMRRKVVTCPFNVSMFTRNEGVQKGRVSPNVNRTGFRARGMRSYRALYG